MLFRSGNAALNGIGWGPANTYTFEITRAPAFNTNAITTIAVPQLSATCSTSATECQEIVSNPGTFDLRATNSTTSITLNAAFTSGTADYSVNGGQSQSLTSGAASSSINLGSGTTLASRITIITITHHGTINSTYVLRVFRMPTLTSVSLRDKSSNTVTTTETQTDDFTFKEEAAVGHSISQLEFDLEGPGWFHGWYGHQEITNINWNNLNWEACCLFHDGVNIETFSHYPFRGNAALNGIGWGPANTYTFEITRAPAFTAPVNISLPSISGSTTIGSTLTASPGSWSGSNHSFAYTWKRSSTLNGSYVDIGSNSPTYEISSADAGKFIKVFVVATANGLSSSAAASASVTIQSPATTTTSPATTTTSTTSTTIAEQVPSNGNLSGGGTPATSNPTETTPTNSDAPTTEAPTTTTEVSESTTTTITADVDAPEVPAVDVGSAVATIDGQEVPIVIERDGDTIVLKVGEVEWRLDATSRDGSPLPLDENGNLLLSTGDRVGIDLQGFGPTTPVEVWLFSIPVKVRDLIADTTGGTQGDFAIPQGIDTGDHRVVVTGLSPDNQEVVVAYGVAVKASGDSGSTTRILLALGVVVLILAITFIVGRMRRRLRS